MAFKDIFVQNQWISSPIAYWTIKYEHERSGVDMKYRFNWKVWLKNSEGWFYNGLQLRLFLNGSEKDITVKGYNASQKGWSYEGTTEWYTVSNKTSGTTPFYAQLYDTNGKDVERTSATYALDISPSAATTTYAEDFTDEGNPTIKFTNDGGFDIIPYLCFYKNDGTTKEFDFPKGKYTSPYTFNLSPEQRTEILNFLNDNTSYRVTEGVWTWDGNTDLGYHSIAKTFTIVNANPTYDKSLISFEDIDETTLNITKNPQIIAQSKSKLSVTCKAATAYKGATISRYEVTIVKPAGVGTREQRLMAKYITNQNGGTVELGAISESGNLIIRVNVVDSRGNGVTAEKDLYVYPYDKPTLSKHTQYGEITCTRCDANGVIDKSGKYLKVIIQGGWHHVNEKNTATVCVQTTTNGEKSAWTPIPNTEIGGGGNTVSHWSNINTKVDGIVIDTAKSYVVAIRCIDEFGEYAELPYKIPTVDVCFHLGKKGNKAAFGKYAEYDKVLEISEKWDLMMKGQVVNDFIVDSGTYNGWSYEKYQSGVMKQWTIITPTFTSWSTWGNDYWYTSSVASYKFAYPFVSQPCINATNWSTSWAIPFIQNATYSGFDIYGVRPSAGHTSANAYYYSIMAIGRWK